jgi:hypothetical protein
MREPSARFQFVDLGVARGDLVLEAGNLVRFIGLLLFSAEKLLKLDDPFTKYVDTFLAFFVHGTSKPA